MPVVSISLVSKLCETELLTYFHKNKVPMIHIILEAKKDSIISRIKNDLIRDTSAQQDLQCRKPLDWKLRG